MDILRGKFVHNQASKIVQIADAERLEPKAMVATWNNHHSIEVKLSKGDPCKPPSTIHLKGFPLGSPASGASRGHSPQHNASAELVQGHALDLTLLLSACDTLGNVTLRAFEMEAINMRHSTRRCGKCGIPADVSATFVEITTSNQKN